MKTLIILLGLFIIPPAYSMPEGKIIPEGRFAPHYGIEKNQVDFSIKSFKLDITSVTMDAYNEFLKKNPSWKKENITRLYADKNYLSEKKSIGKSPVVYVSWFAANAYCESKNGRLPSTLEWEYVAAASEKLRNASKSPEIVDKILRWYSRPEVENEIAIVGKDKANIYGIHDLHGLIWEWTSDFNSVIMTSDNRNAFIQTNASKHFVRASVVTKGIIEFSIFVLIHFAFCFCKNIARPRIPIGIRKGQLIAFFKINWLFCIVEASYTNTQIR